MARPQTLAETAITDLCYMPLATRHPATPPPPMTRVPTGTSKETGGGGVEVMKCPTEGQHEVLVSTSPYQVIARSL